MRIKKQKKTNDALVDKVKDYNIQSSSLSLLINDMMHSGGFESTNLSTGINILQKMMKDMKCTKFLSFIGAIMSTGIRGIIRDMLRYKMFDCVITTCGAIDHDIARTSANYYSGDLRMDDHLLLKKGIHRLGNVLVPTRQLWTGY